MTAEVDWEKMAREILSGGNTPGGHGWPLDEALRLGREIADERAEEIAKHAESKINNPIYGDHMSRQAAAKTCRELAAFARSTIKKHEFKQPPNPDMEANPLVVAPDGAITGTLPCGHQTVSIDHESGNMVPFCEGCRRAAEEEPKSREQALEEALVAIGRTCIDDVGAVDIARRALEWKP